MRTLLLIGLAAAGLAAAPARARDLPTVEEDRRTTLWAAAEQVLENTRTGAVRVAVYPDTEGPGGALQVVDLSYEWGSGPVTTWRAERRAIETRDLAEAPGNADPIAVARSHMTAEIASSANCPGVVEHLERLEPLLAQPLDLPGLGREHGYGGWVIHADQLKLRVAGNFVADQGLGAVTYELNDSHPLGVWTRQFLAALTTCWRPDPGDVE